MSKRLLFVVSEDWYFVSHRIDIAKKAVSDGYDVALLCQFSRHKEVIENFGIKTINWPISRNSKNLFKELNTLIKITLAIRKFQPNLVHSVAIKPVIYSAFACYINGIDARVFALAGLGSIFSSNKYITKMIRPFISNALRFALSGKQSRLILQNLNDCSLLISRNIIEKARIRLIRGSGVDTSIFQIKPIPLGIPLVILPSRMLWGKGVGVFVECANKLKIRGVQARFVLVGEPDFHNPESISELQLKKWTDSGAVEWWGHCDNMPEIYSLASIICLPSSYGEGLPKSLLEAGACGRAIITTDHPGCRDAIDPNKTGILVPINDSFALGEAVMTLLDNSTLCKKMGEAGRLRVEKNFDINSVIKEHFQIYQELE